MKRFLLFMWDNQQGGWNDFEKDFDSLYEVIQYIKVKNNSDHVAEFQIIDIGEGCKEIKLNSAFVDESERFEDQIYKEMLISVGEYNNNRDKIANVLIVADYADEKGWVDVAEKFRILANEAEKIENEQDAFKEKYGRKMSDIEVACFSLIVPKQYSINSLIRRELG